MAYLKEPHWGEGMLLTPHHLQAHQRHVEGMLAEAWRTSAPYSWGFADLKLAEEAIPSGVLSITRCLCRTEKGTWIVVPENARVADRNFEEELDATMSGVLTAYLAVPPLEEFSVNARYETDDSRGLTRYMIEPVELVDENDGHTRRNVDMHWLHARILFEHELSQPAYEKFESVALARVYRAGEHAGAPRADESFIPPVMHLAGSDDLTQMVKAVVDAVKAANRDVGLEMQRRDGDARVSTSEQIERLLRLYTLNDAASVLRQWFSIRELRPLVMYTELCRIGGLLATFRGERAMEYSAYDHKRLGPVFKEVCDHIIALLRARDSKKLKVRPFEVRTETDGLKVKLEQNWLGERSKFYVGIHTPTLSGDELDRFLATDWRVAALDEVEDLFMRGLPGLDFRRLHVHEGLLPSGPEIKYYEIIRTEQAWPRVKETGWLGIHYSPHVRARFEQERIEFKIYVVVEEDES